jgi:hypothetical protein
VSRCRPLRSGVCSALAGLLLIGGSIQLAAQTANEPGGDARLQLGPLALSPSIELTRFGMDTNVFNEFEDAKRDFTFTLSPRVGASLRAGRARLYASSRSDLVYFHRYSSERGAGGAADVRLEVPATRLTPWITGSFLSARQRVGYEIDLRFRRVATEAAAGVDARVGGRTRVGLSVRQGAFRHDPDAVFLGSSLRDVLDRQQTAVGAELRYALTPLTTFVTAVQRSRERFEFTPTRDSSSARVEAGFDLAPSALIGGYGRIGFRRFVGSGGALPRYSGIVAAVTAASTIRGRTRVEVTTERDLNYSWEPDYPYFVLSGVTFAVTPQLTPRWQVTGRTSLRRLAYRTALGVPELIRHRVDRVDVVGGGIGLRVGGDMRLGINVDRERRTSPVRRRAFEAVRTGISVTYGR